MRAMRLTTTVVAFRWLLAAMTCALILTLAAPATAKKQPTPAGIQIDAELPELKTPEVKIVEPPPEADGTPGGCMTDCEGVDLAQAADANEPPKIDGIQFIEASAGDDKILPMVPPEPILDPENASMGDQHLAVWSVGDDFSFSCQQGALQSCTAVVETEEAGDVGKMQISGNQCTHKALDSFGTITEVYVTVSCGGHDEHLKAEIEQLVAEEKQTALLEESLQQQQ